MCVGRKPVFLFFSRADRCIFFCLPTFCLIAGIFGTPHAGVCELAPGIPVDAISGEVRCQPPLACILARSYKIVKMGYLPDCTFERTMRRCRHGPLCSLPASVLLAQPPHLGLGPKHHAHNGSQGRANERRNSPLFQNVVNSPSLDSHAPLQPHNPGGVGFAPLLGVNTELHEPLRLLLQIDNPRFDVGDVGGQLPGLVTVGFPLRHSASSAVTRVSRSAILSSIVGAGGVLSWAICARVNLVKLRSMVGSPALRMLPELVY